MRNKELEEQIKQASSYLTLLMLAGGNLYDVYHSERKNSAIDLTMSWLMFFGVLLFGAIWLQQRKKEKRKKVREINRALEEFPEGSAVMCKKNKNIYLAYKVDFDSEAPVWHLARLVGKEEKGKLEKKTILFSNIKSYRTVNSSSREIEEQISNIRLALYEEEKNK